MKKLLFTLFLGATLLPGLVARADYTPPTDSQLDALMANSEMAAVILEDANGNQAAELLLRIITLITNDDNLGEKGRVYLIAEWTSRFVKHLPSAELESFATLLAASVPADVKNTVFAGMSVGGAGNNAFIEVLQELAGDDDSLLNSILRPEVTLTRPIYNLLVSNIANIQTVPPSPNITTPIIIPGGGLPQVTPTPLPPPPPVGQGYDGQG